MPPENDAPGTPGSVVSRGTEGTGAEGGAGVGAAGRGDHAPESPGVIPLAHVEAEKQKQKKNTLLLEEEEEGEERGEAGPSMSTSASSPTATTALRDTSKSGDVAAAGAAADGTTSAKRETKTLTSQFAGVFRAMGQALSSSLTKLWTPATRRGDGDGGGQAEGKQRRVYRSWLHRFVVWVTETNAFSGLIMLVIVTNTIFIAVETDRTLAQESAVVFQGADLVFLVVYTIEFVLKVYAEPRGYWGNGYNRFDFAILAFSYLQFLDTVFAVLSVLNEISFLRVLRALRALRALRGVSFIRGLQVILVALMKTLYGIVNLVFLLLLLMYVFAILGLNFFGVWPEGRAQWGTLGDAFFTLFTFVTADGWTDTQATLDSISMSSRIYTVFFLFIGHFIFTNLFIGVVIQNLDEAQEEDKRQQMYKRKKVLAQKKKSIMSIQQLELDQLLRQAHRGDVDIQAVLQDMVGTLRHNDLVPMRHLSCSITWLETYMITLYHQERAMSKAQHLHFEVANTLAGLVQQRLHSKPRKASAIPVA